LGRPTMATSGASLFLLKDFSQSKSMMACES
jgi:hypothetical protein